MCPKSGVEYGSGVNICNYLTPPDLDGVSHAALTFLNCKFCVNPVYLFGRVPSHLPLSYSNLGWRHIISGDNLYVSCQCKRCS